jgi:hypothetical protein
MKIKHSSIALVSAITLLFCSCVQNNKKSTHEVDQKNGTIIKLSPVVFGGNRYVVEADFGLDKKVPLMVHGNASLYLMLTHDIAEKLNNGKPIEKIRDYGYSKKGRGKINIEKFMIGDKTFSNTENVPVFDWPEEEGKAAQGMIGIQFLKNENVRIDFVNEQMKIGIEVTEQPDKNLIDQGYAFTNFFIENNEAYMNVYFDALKKEIPITIGTVSDDYSFDVETFKSGIEIEKTELKGHSPNSTTPQVYTNLTPIIYRIANQSFEIPIRKVELYSFAEYENVSQSQLFPFGIFGRDWMKKNNAIIDYANKILYFKINSTVNNN